MKSFALASQQTSIAAILLGANVCGLKLTLRDLRLTVAYLNFTSPGYIAVCKQPYLAGLFGVFYLIYAGQCSFARVRVDILSDARGPCIATSWPDCDMDISHEILRMCENPLPATNYDVWKLREKLDGNADYRSRRKGTRVENKLKPYEATAGKADTDNKLKDKPIEYHNDEYCKVSAPKPSDDSEEDCNTRPRELKTNTAFGRSKVPFDKFARQHVGGGVPDCTLTQPLASQPARCHGVDTRIRNAAEGSYEGAATSMTDYFETDDISLKCCGGNVDSAIDYCTCMFCVKGLYFHCTKDSCPESALVEPCSCSPVDGGCVKRWTALGFCALFFPCLICYPITRSCTEVCKCYKKQQASMKERRSRTVQSRERLR